MEYPTCPQSTMGIGGRDSPCRGLLHPVGYLLNSRVYAHVPVPDDAIILTNTIWRCTTCRWLMSSAQGTGTRMRLDAPCETYAVHIVYD
jgi:hypothetical protein